MTTDYNKTDGLSPTTRKLTGHNSDFAQTTIPTNIHTANIIFTNIILMADKHNIPYGKLHSNCSLLPDHILCKLTQRNNIRRANTCDLALKLLNEEITSDKQTYGRNTWMHTRITCTTRTFFGRPYTVYPTEHHHPHTKHIHNIHQTIHKHCQTRNTQDKQIQQQSNAQNTRT